MATKLKPNEVTQLKAVGIKGATTVEDARKSLISYLAENEVDNVDDETLADLINMAEAFYDADAPSTTEEDNDDLAEEVAEDEEGEEEEVPADDDEEEEEEPVVKTKTTSKTVAKVTPKTAVKSTPAVKVVAKTPAPAKKAVVRDENNVVFDARNNEEHLEFLDIFKEIFTDDEYEIKILKQGFTVRLLGSNATPTIMNFDELRIIDNTYLKGNAYFNRLKNVEELDGFLTEELLEEEEHKDGKKVEYTANYSRGMFRGETHPSIKGITQDQLFDILGVTKNKKGDWEATEEGYLAVAMDRASGTDKKMGENRQKMEEKLEASKAPVAKKASVTKKK